MNSKLGLFFWPVSFVDSSMILRSTEISITPVVLALSGAVHGSLAEQSLL